MDITALIVPVLGPLVAQLKPLIAGVVLAILLQFAKQADSVKILPADNADRIKKVAAVLSFIAAALVAFSEGNLALFDWSGVANIVADFLVVSLTSAGTWALALKGKNLLSK